MAKVLENIREVVEIKNELRKILIAVGMNPTDKFDEYADEFRAALDILDSKTSQIIGE